MKEFVFSKSALVRLFGFNPNPDDPGEPHGPGSPVVHDSIADRIAWVLLNPQPLPPKVAAGSRMGPRPEPWRSARLARAVIDQITRELQIAEVAGRGEQGGQAAQTRFAEFIDDFCGTRVPGRPRPPHWVTPAATPEDLLTAAAQFQMAADGLGKGTLQTACETAADKLFETGLKGLEMPQAKAVAG